MIDLIILASGIGARCDLGYPKQLFKIKNETMLSYIINIFKQIKDIDNIIVTYTPEQKELFIEDMSIHKNALFIKGGDTRQESVYNALKYVQNKRVIIHESARPFITKDFIQNIISIDEDCVVPYVPITTTVYYAEQFEYINRDSLYNIQLPQIFNSNKLKVAHESARRNNSKYTDDSSLYFNELNEVIYFTKGLDENIKITTKFDLELLRKLGECND